MSQQNTELEGIERLRSGSLFMILSALLLTIGIIVIILAGLAIASFSFTSSASFSFTSSSVPPASSTGVVAGFFGALVGIAIVLVISAVIGLLGILRIRSGFSILKNVGRDVGIGATGTTIYLVGLIIILIGALLTFILVGIPILILGDILLLIGGVLIGLGFYRVGEVYNEGTVKIGGILVLVGSIIADLLSFIGFLLIYIGLGKIKPQQTLGMQQPYVSQPMVPQVYQIGQGVIRSNGYAYISLYSSAPANIISAKIEGTNIISTTITPITLQTGNNEVTIFFGNVQSLAPNTTYIITLTINIGGNIINISTVASYQP
ncbi:DUF973 family protein [Saccharolobus solfataricus]|uniref:DUF973 family protein n=2 Tax=Saccharolobus solfataricus TaxID=2287 RepID=A0A0E3KA43_SACSO|nr:DUF973 family protein [Saccharolobus solfataricus]AKA74574.1 DUF973 family protein [Saccharolobus solfataricus]AKA77270.1 DUF973 family protein [Saccharolobus solfataricus]AKA79962.1 DUF973 family protein [Saccharolobus solfataricus]AZF69048.1 DUF973 family protein [Saccharolobus solfataricus]AZF71668.1 DUF973 family protein [Saccharolobus solfataricus]